MLPNCDLPILAEGVDTLPLFYPFIPDQSKKRVLETLGTRWIGQGPQVDEFERQFSSRFCNNSSTIAVGSGTDALHLAYLLAGIGPGDEVITPVFTCTATNIPLLYMGAKPVFADIDPLTLNISVDHVRELISDRTKAIICVHYGGLPCDMDELLTLGHKFGIPVIEDAAHAVGATYGSKSIGSISDFTMFSFQAIKHITTGDGGMLSFLDSSKLETAKRLRWFGIDRSKKQGGTWENDIVEVGYKYQMTDIAAAMGIGALEVFESTLEHRQNLLFAYESELVGNSDVQLLTGLPRTDRGHAAWLMTIAVEDRQSLVQKLRAHKIESGQVHYRNDRYSIFADSRCEFPNMDLMEDRYLVLPLHLKMTFEDVERIGSLIRAGW